MFAIRTRLPRTTRLAALALLGGIVLGACVPTNGGFYPAPTPEPPQIQTRTFNEPQVGGRWLDVCFAHGSCREQRAVNTFCQQQGYDRSISHQSRMTPPFQTNVRIGDQSVCRAAVGNCHRVTRLTCERTV